VAEILKASKFTFYNINLNRALKLSQSSASAGIVTGFNFALFYFEKSRCVENCFKSQLMCNIFLLLSSVINSLLAPVVGLGLGGPRQD